MKRLLHLPASAAVLIAMALTLPVSGSAMIVPQHSIAGVKLGSSERAIKAKLGPPLHVYKGTNPFGPWRRFVYPQVTISFQNGDRATMLLTKSSKERTASGVGLGSTLAQVRAGLHGEKCKAEFGVFHCWTGRWEPGQVVTDFHFKHSLVTQVGIGYVLD